MRIKNVFLKGILPFVILAIGLLMMRALIMNRPVPVKKERMNPGALVESVVVSKEERQALVSSSGTVQAEQEMQISMQVSGVITWVDPGFVNGGFFKQGEKLFSVEKSDYQLAVERAKAALVKAETDFSLTEGKAQIARLEWQRLNKESNATPNPLVVFEPQMAAAKANVSAAQAALQQAKIDLSRTEITAPFNCRVRAEQVAIGQYVRIGTSVATLVSTDNAEIIVPLPLNDLPWIQIPYGKKNKGSEVLVKMMIDGQTYEWQGRIDRSLGEVDPKSRMAQIVVAVPNPYDHKKQGSGNGIALEAGMFVNVSILGRTMQDVSVLPRKGVRDNSTVWLMDDDFKLRIKQVEIVRHEQDDVWITAGIQEGARVVLTSLAGGAEGMQLRRVEKGDI